MADHKIVRDGIELIGRNTGPDRSSSGFDSPRGECAGRANAFYFFLGVGISTNVLGGLRFSHVFRGLDGARYGSSGG